MADALPEDETLHDKALRHANEAWEAESENFDNGRDDMRFEAGEQWLTEAKEDRLAKNRPITTVNRVSAFIRQVTGDVRRDTPANKVIPSKDGSKEVADIYTGLIRNIEVQSNAKAAYIQAVENACRSGLGAIKVVTEYSDNDGFDQDIRIKRITDPFAVVWDPHAREPDKSDARFLHEYFDLPKEEFQRRYPKADMSDVPTGTSGIAWFSNDSVKLAAYWYKEPAKKILLSLADGRTIDEKTAAQETAQGAVLEVVNKRKVDCYAIKMCLMSGKEIIEGPHDWAGKYLPYAPVIGEERWVDGRCERKGMVRDLKDAQRAYNYARTVDIETMANQPKTPYIGTAKQFGLGTELEELWKKAGTTNWPFLPYNPDPQAPGPPQRVEPVKPNPGISIQAQIAADDMKAITGIYDASLGQRSNETSGRAIMARQREGDTGTYHYIDNLGTGIRHVGRILVDLIPKIYDTPRMVRVLKEDGAHEMVKVNRPEEEAMEEAGPGAGMEVIRALMNDLAAGEYDVTVTVGPSFATRREEARETMTELFRAMPQLGAVAADLFVKSLDIPYADEIAERLKPKEGEQQADPVQAATAMDKAASADLKMAQVAKTQAETAALLTQFQMQMQQVLALVQGNAQPPMAAPQQPTGGEAPALEMAAQPPGAPPPAEDEPEIVDMEPLPEGAA